MNKLPDSLTSTAATDDLRDLAQHAGPFLSIALPSPSSHDDAAHRLAVRWKNARSTAERTGWPADRLGELDELVENWEHGSAAAFVIVQSIDGARLEETLVSELSTAMVSVDASPRLFTILENRQRMLPHVVVVTDRAGADITAFDGGVVTLSDQVEGERLHIHRGHPGGWSQRRFQQRAENTWEHNADSVVEATLDVLNLVEPVVIAVAGEVRAQSLVEKGLRDRTEIPIASIDAGDPDGIADEVIRVVDDRHARFLRSAIQSMRDSHGTDRLLRGDEVMDALEQGRVDTIFVNDVDDHARGAADDEIIGSVESPIDRLSDRAIAQALATRADVVVIPAVADLVDGVAAITRW